MPHFPPLPELEMCDSSSLQDPCPGGDVGRAAQSSPRQAGAHTQRRALCPPGVSTVARKKPSQSLWRRQIW